MALVSKIPFALNILFVIATEYLLLTGIVFLFLYIWRKTKFWYFKIQQQFPLRKHVLREIKYSCSSLVIFSVVILFVLWAGEKHLTLIYNPINKYGYGYYVFSILLMIVVHDTYFYWAHRLMHWKPLFKTVHKIHHLSHNPTPFTSYAFHPVEALIQVGIMPLVVFTIPYHLSAVVIFFTYESLMNVLGHVGYEFYPKGFVNNKYLKWHNTSTNHNMHHQFVKCNYGLYFNIWDRIMKTNHPRYKEMFEELVEQRKQR